MAFLLGGFGIHRFYLGQWWGLFYLLICWTGISALVALVEFMYFLVCDQKKWDAKHNEGIPKGPNEVGGAGVVFVIIAAIIGGIFLIGIIAAVTLPAYQDYVMRGRVIEAIAETTTEVRARVEQ